MPSWGYPGLIDQFQGSLFGVARFGNFVGKDFSVPAQEGWYLPGFQG